MTDGIDNDDVERFNRKVPGDLVDQTQIKDWMDGNTNYLPDEARGHLADRIEAHRQGGGDGLGEEPPDPEGGSEYDPDRGSWEGDPGA